MAVKKSPQHSIIKSALYDIEEAWNEIKTTPVNMSVTEFEKRILRQAERDGLSYSTTPGSWLDIGKKALADHRVPQEQKNLILAEANPPELRRSIKNFLESFLMLCRAAEWSYQDLKDFLADDTKDARLRRFLRWRAFLSAEAFHKLDRLNLRGEKAKRAYQKLIPKVVLRTK